MCSSFQESFAQALKVCRPQIEARHPSTPPRPSYMLYCTHVAGEAVARVHSTTLTPDSIITLPWSPTHISPEAWEAYLPGSIVGLHYATLSLATPVTVDLQLFTGPLLSSAAFEPRLTPTYRLSRSDRLQAGEAGVEGTALSGAAGVAHLEAQYGRAFPPRWLWAQGHQQHRVRIPLHGQPS